MAMRHVPAATKEMVAGFVKGHLPPSQLVRSDKLAAFGSNLQDPASRRPGRTAQQGR